MLSAVDHADQCHHLLFYLAMIKGKGRGSTPYTDGARVKPKWRASQSVMRAILRRYGIDPSPALLGSNPIHSRVYSSTRSSLQRVHIEREREREMQCVHSRLCTALYFNRPFCGTPKSPSKRCLPYQIGPLGRKNCRHLSRVYTPYDRIATAV